MKLLGETPLQCLLAWRKNSALDEDEEVKFKKIVKLLKSPLDTNAGNQSSLGHLLRTQVTNRKPDIKSRNILGGTSKLDVDRKKILENKFIEDFPPCKRLANRRSDEDSQSEESKESDDSITSLDKSGCAVYKNTMKRLRHKQKKFKKSVLEKEKSKPALIDARKYIDNCIMDNDDEEEEEHNSLCDVPTQKLEDENEVNFVQFDGEEYLSRLLQDIETSPLTHNSQNLSVEDECKSKPWLKSLPTDLVQDNFETPKERLKENLTLENEEEKFTETLKNLTSSNTSDKTVENHKKEIAFTVKIFNDEIKVSVKEAEMEQLKVEWLIQEVAKKYSILNNPDYYVFVHTEKGLSIGESNSLIELCNKKIEFSVKKWKLLPLSERYEKVCTKKTHPDITSDVKYSATRHSLQSQVVEVFKEFPKSRCLTLSNLKLSFLKLIPICKAVKYEPFVQVLNLSNNYFGDKGVEIIVKMFEKVIIAELNLSGCSITSSGIYHLNDALDEVNELSKNGLEVLNLSYNPITDDAAEALSEIVEKLPNLNILNIDHCELETPISNKGSINLVIIQGDKFESSLKNNN